MEGIRKPFEGVANIIRFNSHYYGISAVIILLILFFRKQFSPSVNLLVTILIFIIVIITFITLLISAWVYDFSGLYQFNWIPDYINNPKKILNVNAGFDETSSLLQKKYPGAELCVADFYNPIMHTEISIRKARKKYPPFPGTGKVITTQLPYPDKSFDNIFAFLSAHEIRNAKERIDFFTELRRVVKNSGQIIVTEHLRDVANFAAYNIGFFHFHSKASWKDAFAKSSLIITDEFKITPFITTFILQKNGSSS